MFQDAGLDDKYLMDAGNAKGWDYFVQRRGGERFRREAWKNAGAVAAFSGVALCDCGDALVNEPYCLVSVTGAVSKGKKVLCTARGKNPSSPRGRVYQVELHMHTGYTLWGASAM